MMPFINLNGMNMQGPVEYIGINEHKKKGGGKYC